MAEAGTCRPVTARARVQCRAISCQICGGQIGSGTGFSSSTSVYSNQYHPTNATYASLSQHYFIRTSGRSLGTFVVDHSTGKQFHVAKYLLGVLHTKYSVYTYFFLAT